MKNALGTFLFIIMVIMAYCQPGSKEEQNHITTSKDTTTSKKVKPAESGYADVNGLKMYYEVYGNGKPVVLLHGSYMTIPLNCTPTGDTVECLCPRWLVARCGG